MIYMYVYICAYVCQTFWKQTKTLTHPIVINSKML